MKSPTGSLIYISIKPVNKITDEFEKMKFFDATAAILLHSQTCECKYLILLIALTHI